MENGEGYFLKNGLRRGGRYDTIFFSLYGGTNTFDIRCRLDLKQRLNRARLQKAANEALESYPEFRTRPVIYNGRIAYEENYKPVRIADDDNKRYFFGSDGPMGTNGYLFLFLVGERNITFSMFHGQTDAYGMISYIIAVLWRYAQYSFPFLRVISPKFFEAYGVRLNRRLFDAMDDVERYDSVVKFKGEGEFVQLIEPGTLYRMPDEVYSKEEMTNRIVNLEVSNTAFLQKTRELHTSFAPLLAAIAGEAINSAYDIGDKVISINVPVDSRRFFGGTKTLCNMAYDCMLPLRKEDLDMPLENICAKIKASQQKQMTKSHVNAMFKFIYDLSLQLDDMGDIDKSNEILSGPDGMKAQADNMTLFLTYPGRVDNNIISRLLLNGVTPGMLSMERAINVYAHRDSLIIQISMKSDDMTLVNALRKALKRHGFDPKVYDMGVVAQNKLDFSQIKRIEERET
ncbi:MAG: hypothetical protein IK118_07315 [Clostridia bacterium]|nr:hypothetical protein [Clostridia bacterium]